MRDEFLSTESWEQDGCRVTRVTLRVAGRELTCMMRREPHTDTLWTVEHFVKDRDDLLAYLQLPDAFFDETVTGRAVACRGTGVGRPRDRDGRHRRSAVRRRDADEHAGLHGRGVYREPSVSSTAGEAGSSPAQPHGTGRARVPWPPVADLRTRVCLGTVFAAASFLRVRRAVCVPHGARDSSTRRVRGSTATAASAISST